MASPIDTDRLNSLTDNNPALLKEFFKIFFASAEEMLGVLRNAALATPEWKHAAHRLKGSSATMGATFLSTACGKAELAQATENRDLHLEQISQKYADIRQFCQERNILS